MSHADMNMMHIKCVYNGIFAGVAAWPAEQQQLNGLQLKLRIIIIPAGRSWHALGSMTKQLHISPDLSKKCLLFKVQAAVRRLKTMFQANKKPDMFSPRETERNLSCCR